VDDINPWWWVVAAAGLAVAALAWCEYTNTGDDTSWTDPHQPGAMETPLIGDVSRRILRGKPHKREYPGCLADWPGTVVGDC
jgi:hypothetical protein